MLDKCLVERIGYIKLYFENQFRDENLYKDTIKNSLELLSKSLNIYKE